MTTPPRIVINAQTARHEVERLVNVARHEARQRKRLRNLTRFALWLIAWACIGALSAVVFAWGVALLAG